ncbi:hypothetical protein, partial [Salmonella enterica]|uniref:hypothetical protein n=1 Tax=Salmonella enterica TaxID=28901 RepID=UPI00398C7A2A
MVIVTSGLASECWLACAFDTALVEVMLSAPWILPPVKALSTTTVVSALPLVKLVSTLPLSPILRLLLFSVPPLSLPLAPTSQLDSCCGSCGLAGGGGLPP